KLVFTTWQFSGSANTICALFQEASMSFTTVAKRFSLIAVWLCCCSWMVVAQTPKHRLTLDDISQFREVRDPQLSPDGQWVAYVVSTIDPKEDKSVSHIWTVSYDGKIQRQMTFGSESESAPRWSPD